MLKRIKRLKIIGLIGIVYSIFLFIDYFIGEKSKIELIIGCLLFICSIIFIITSNSLFYNMKPVNKKDSSKK